jgi:hypothetical protein
LFIGNNGLQLARVGIPEAELIERHRLIAVVLRPVGVLGMIGLIVLAIFGRLGEGERVRSFAFERMKVVRSRIGTRPFKVATDGEVEELTSPLTFRIASHPLLLLRPADPGEAS